MTERNIARLVALSLYALAFSIFISVSIIPIFHLFILSAFVILLREKQISFLSIPKSAWCLIAFTSVQILSAVFNYRELQDKARSFGSLKYPLIGVITLMILCQTKVSENQFLKKHAAIAFNIFLASIWLAFLYSIAKVYSGYLEGYHQSPTGGIDNFRFGGFTDIMRYGYGSAIAILIILALLVNKSSHKATNTVYLLLSFVVGFLGMYFSYTRGAMLGFLLGAPVILYFFNKRITKIVSSVSIGLIAVMVVFAVNGGSSSSRFLLNSESSSNLKRNSQYQAALYAFQERPILGYGPQQFKFHVQEIKEKYNVQYPDFISHAHNVFLQIAADSGIIGLLTFLIWLGIWFYEILKNGNNFAKQVFFPLILFILIAGQVEMLFMAQTSTLIFSFIA